MAATFNLVAKNNKKILIISSKFAFLSDGVYKGPAQD